MQGTVYVFVNDKGWFFGDRESAGLKRGTPPVVACFFESFQQAKLFSSVWAAVKYRSGIINTNISIQMTLMPINVTYSEQDIFKAILKHD